MALLTAFPAVRGALGGRWWLVDRVLGRSGSTDPWSEGLQLNQLKIYEGR